MRPELSSDEPSESTMYVQLTLRQGQGRRKFEVVRPSGCNMGVARNMDVSWVWLMEYETNDEPVYSL